MGVLNPSGKILGSGLTYPLRGYIDGLITANAADADHDITIGEGEATDSSKSTLMTLYSPLTKQIDATWSQGTNAGGLFAGVSLGNTTWYHMFLIKHSNGGIDCGFDTSVVAANRPSGWNYYRRIGSVLTNASANILAYVQFENGVFYWNTPITDVNSGSIGTAAVSVTISTPLGVKTVPIIIIQASKAEAYVASRASSLDMPNLAVAFPAITDYSYWITGGGSAPMVNFNMPRTNTSSQIRIRTDTASSAYWVFTHGWIDPRGRDS